MTHPQDGRRCRPLVLMNNLCAGQRPRRGRELRPRSAGGRTARGRRLLTGRGGSRAEPRRGRAAGGGPGAAEGSAAGGRGEAAPAMPL